MPSRISIELSPTSDTNTVMAGVASATTASSIHSDDRTGAAIPTPVTKKPVVSVHTIATSPPGSGMDNATMGRPDGSPSSSVSLASFRSSSMESSPSSSTESLSTPNNSDKGKGKGKSIENNGSSNGGKGKSTVFALDTDKDNVDREQYDHGHRAGYMKTVANHSAVVPPSAQSPDILLPTNGKGKGKEAISNFGRSRSDDDDDEYDEHSNSLNGDNIAEGKGKGKGKGKGTYVSTTSNSPSKSDFYNSSNGRSSDASSLTSLSSVEEEEEEDLNGGAQSKAPASLSSTPVSSAKIRPATVSAMSGSGARGRASRSISVTGSSSAAGSSSVAHPRVASASAQYSHGSGAGAGSSSAASSSSGFVYGSASGSGSGSGSGFIKPSLNRASTTPASFQRPSLTSAGSSSAVPQVPSLPTTVTEASVPDYQQDFSQFGYESIPADFDYGDLPFYDTDPRTGTIYGDPQAITRPHLVPEAYFDLYRFLHDPMDPRKTNVFNKHGMLLYFHPGRHVGQEQDSLRVNVSNTPVWTMVGRTSTWGNLTATEISTKRQIRIVMEDNKKKASSDPSAPSARYVFRWKDNDFVTEYRKQKDQYRITTFQMCGGESHYKPPQPKPLNQLFHGTGMDHPGNPYPTVSLGDPSPFDSSRYLQLISEYRLNSGPVMKKGDFELHNPDTFPIEFRTFLMLQSIVILDSMRPVDDKLFYKQFPEAVHLRRLLPTSGGLKVNAISNPNGGFGSPRNMVGSGLPISSTSSLSDDHRSTKSAGMKSTSALSAKGQQLATPPPTPSLTRHATVGATTADSRSKSTAAVPPVPSVPAVPAVPLTPTLKKSRWGSIFKK